MAISRAPWDGSASRWPTTEAYCSACLIDDNPAGEAKVQSKCHLPVKEPGSGNVNANAVHAAAQRLSSTESPSKAKAARALLRYYGQLQEEPPDSLRRAANAPMNNAIRRASGRG